MQYRLLRNNIEYGPFSKDDLLHQGLKATDQIKIVGENSWRAVSSFADFKSLLEPAAKPKYKFTADRQLVEIKKEDTPVANSKVINPEEPAANSPFKRTPSAVPKKKSAYQSPPATQVGSAHPHEGEKSLNRKETRAEPNQPFVKSNTIHHIEHAPKFEHHRKITPKTVKKKQAVSNSSFTKEFIFPIFIIGGIGCLVWWGYQKYTSSQPPVTVADTIAQTAIIDSSDAKKATPPKDSIEEKTASTGAATTIAKASHLKPSTSDSLRRAEKQQKVRDSLAAVKRKAASTVAANLKDSQATAAKSPAKVEPLKENQPPETTSKQTPDQKTIEPKTAAATKPAEAPKKQAVKKPSSINDYVNMSLNKTPENGIKNVKITIENVSKDDLNIAVIEVKYFDATGNFIKGETLQSGKIKAGKSVTLKVPNSKEASRLSYKASLISGDNVYLMGK